MKHKTDTPSKIIFETYGVKYTWETDHSDLILSEVIEAFRRLLTAHGFNDKGVLEVMRNYAEEELECLGDCDSCMCIEIPEDDVTIHHTVLKEIHK